MQLFILLQGKKNHLQAMGDEATGVIPRFFAD